MLSSGRDATAVAPTGLDGIVRRVGQRRDAWVRVDLAERIEYLRRCRDGLLTVAPEWVARACEAKGIDPSSPAAGEEWLSGPVVTLQGFRMMAHALRHGGQPPPAALGRDPEGRWVARVFPLGLLDRLTYPATTVEIRIEPGRPPTQGRIYREKAEGRFGPGQLALVLGAGNIASIPPLDLLHKLFAEDQVVVLKMNPVNDYLAPLLERAMAPLIEDGFLAIVSGGPETGEFLTRHPAVDTLHLTGSHHTHDAILWGSDPEERERRKSEGRPLTDKPFTSELGCVTPVLVVPGPWNRSDIAFHARNVASMVAHNGSFNCNAAKVVVLWRGWEDRPVFLDALRAALRAIPPRRAYYPGARERYRSFLERYPGAEVLGNRDGGAVPWALLPDVPPRADEYALRQEAFCGVLAEVALDAPDAAAFLDQAVSFANDTVWGSLSSVVLAHPASVRRDREGFRRALARLRYGAVAVNAWSGLVFALGVASWGAFPGNPPENVESGRGAVHNAMLFDHPERTLLRAPFRPWLKPPWFADHATLDVLGRRLARFEAKPSWTRLPALAFAAVRG